MLLVAVQRSVRESSADAQRAFGVNERRQWKERASRRHGGSGGQCLDVVSEVIGLLDSDESEEDVVKLLGGKRSGSRATSVAAQRS